MSIDSVVKLIGRPNIAGDLSKEKLIRIAEEVITRADRDKASMKDWSDVVDEGIKLCAPEFKGKDQPFPNSANFKSPLLAEAANNFGNRATNEIMRDPRLVKASITGLATIKNVIEKKSSEVAQWETDLEGVMAQVEQLSQTSPDDPQIAEMQKLGQEITAKIAEHKKTIKAKKDAVRQRNERADRVSELMNWQVNHKMTEWRKDQKRLMYSLPNIGSVFKKTYYDATLGRCVSRVINYPDFIVNQKTNNPDSCRSFTHVLTFSRSEVEVRRKNGLWVDEKVYEVVDNQDDLDAGTDEQANVDDTNDNPDRFYEQYCWLDLDGDGVEEPYIVTVHVESCQTVRIVARYNEDSIVVKFEDFAPMVLTDAQKKRAARITAENEEFLTGTPIPDAEDLAGYSIVRVEPMKILTKYGFIPSSDGTYLDVGFYHLIGSLVMANNKTSNDLLNSGTLANQQGGIVAKNFRKKAGSFSWKMGEYMQTELSPDELQSGIMSMPYKEPSQSLFMLNEKMDATARGFSANVDIGSQIQSNTAPTTAIAIVQESLVPHTAHMSMIVDAMSDEFQVLFELNRAYLDSSEYIEIVGDDEAVFEDDFNTDGLTVSCGANPEMSSRMQRAMLSEAEMSQLPYVIQAGGNPVPILKNYYKRIGSDNLDEIFPNEAEMSPEEKAQMQQMQQMQQATLEQQQQQTQLITLQTELLKKGEERKDREAEVKALETRANILKTNQATETDKAKEILTLEQAETEQVNNKLNTYTAVAAALDKKESAQEGLNEPTAE